MSETSGTSNSPEISKTSARPEVLVPSLKSSRNAINRRFEQGLFAYHRGQYSNALKEFEKACDAATNNGDTEKFIESCTYILRILAEREEFAKIERIEASVLRLISQSEIDLKIKSRAMYVIGICCCYQETRHEEAMNRFREAIDAAIRINDKEALAGPLYGAATVLYARGKYDAALRELSHLDVLLTCLSLPDLASASHLLRALIRRSQGLLDESLESAWAAYETLKDHPHMVLYLHTLCLLGSIYSAKGDVTCAKLYLDLARRSIKRQEFPRVARLLDEAWGSMRQMDERSADLIFDTKTGVLTERRKGEIRFDGQFVLQDLLRTFLEKPGQVFTKEDLAKYVWRENYVQHIHDNKIYVTIKRLRKMLESDSNKTEYIMRAKNGYFLNPKVRVQIDNLDMESAGQGG